MFVICAYKTCDWRVSINEGVAVLRDNCFFASWNVVPYSQGIL